MPKDCHRTGCCKKCFLFQEINSNQHLLGQHKNVHSVVHSEHLELISVLNRSCRAGAVELMEKMHCVVLSQSRLMYIFYLTDTMPCVSRVTWALLFMVLSSSSLSHSWVSSQTAHYKQHTYIFLFYSWQFGALWELSKRWRIYPDINSPVHILFLSGKSSMHNEKWLKFFVLTVTYILFIDFYCIYSFIHLFLFIYFIYLYL